MATKGCNLLFGEMLKNGLCKKVTFEHTRISQLATSLKNMYYTISYVTSQLCKENSRKNTIKYKWFLHLNSNGGIWCSSQY
jgi:hypothetical protein